jgi:hypothetical protein
MRSSIDITEKYAEDDRTNIEILGGNHGQEGVVGTYDGYCVCPRFGKRDGKGTTS